MNCELIRGILKAMQFCMLLLKITRSYKVGLVVGGRRGEGEVMGLNPSY